MSNQLYPKAKEQMLQGGINLSSGNVRVALVDTASYTYSAAHQFLSSVTGITATTANLTSKTFTNGLFDAADIAFTAVSGAVSEALIVYIDTGSAATSPLIAYFDTGITNLPVTPNGGDINLAWSVSGIFQL